MSDGTGTKDDPWQLHTAPGSSEYTMYRDEDSRSAGARLPGRIDDAEVPRCARSTTCTRGCVEQGDWVQLGAADEKKAARAGTVEAWGRAADNPVGGWYGLRKGYRGRFGMYLPPLLEALGLAELTHETRNNRIRAV